ncbi:MAG: M48 family peptidase, partial [Methylophilaceae bacterium]|nr:M48 family peptidase [Methylophilaceae bacterium]
MALTFNYLIIFLIIFTALAQIWLARRHVAHVTNHRSKVPSPFKDIIKIKDHQKAADYTVAKSNLNVLGLIVEAIFLYLITIGGGIQWINEYLSGYGLTTMIAGTILIVSVLVLSSIVEMPLGLYKTFVIDEKFGFNRMTLGIFISDLIKQSIIALIIGLPVLYFSLWIIGNLGDLWWLWLWIFISAFNFIMLAVYPIFIAPLFNKFEPMKNKTLVSQIEKLLKKCGFESNGLFVMNG